jgi:hypothetical protein
VLAQHARGAQGGAPAAGGGVVFTDWTASRVLRHPSWRGLRAGKDPGQVHRESCPLPGTGDVSLIREQFTLTGSGRRFALPAQGEKGDVVSGMLASDKGSHHRNANVLRRPGRHGRTQPGDAVIERLVPPFH